MDTAVIKSANSSTTLTFCHRHGEYFVVVYTNPQITVKQSVWGYTDCNLLVNLFNSIAKQWKGWKGVKKGESVEGEFSIAATSDNMGHIMLAMTIKKFDGPEECLLC